MCECGKGCLPPAEVAALLARVERAEAWGAEQEERANRETANAERAEEDRAHLLALVKVEREAGLQAIAEEREACAAEAQAVAQAAIDADAEEQERLGGEYPGMDLFDEGYMKAAQRIVSTIRARGEHA
jgi:hypothetical protein